MKLALSVVESQAGSSWEEVEELGLLSTNLATGDKVKFSQKNLEKSDTLVTIFITEVGADAPKMLACSARVSNAVRKGIKAGKSKNSILRALLAMKIIKNDKGHFLSATGSQEEGLTKAQLLKEEEVTWEELAF